MLIAMHNMICHHPKLLIFHSIPNLKSYNIHTADVASCCYWCSCMYVCFYRSGFFVDLRLTAIDCLAEVIKGTTEVGDSYMYYIHTEQQCEEDLMFLLELAANDTNLLVRYEVCRLLLQGINLLIL